MTKINLREIMGPVGIIRKGKTKNALLQKIISMLVQIGDKILAPITISLIHVPCDSVIVVIFFKTMFNKTVIR